MFAFFEALLQLIIGDRILKWTPQASFMRVANKAQSQVVLMSHVEPQVALMGHMEPQVVLMGHMVVSRGAC